MLLCFDFSFSQRDVLFSAPGTSFPRKEAALFSLSDRGGGKLWDFSGGPVRPETRVCSPTCTHVSAPTAAGGTRAGRGQHRPGAAPGEEGVLQCRRRRRWRLEVQPSQVGGGGCGRRKRRPGSGRSAGASSGRARREWERARREHAGALLQLALGRRAAREQPAAGSPCRALRGGQRLRSSRHRPPAPSSAQRRPQRDGPPCRPRALSPAQLLAAGAGWADAPRGRPERGLGLGWGGSEPRAAARGRRRSAAGTDGGAGRSRAAARRQRRGRRQGAPPARMLRFLRRTFGRRSMQRYARGAAGRGAAGLGDERDGGLRGGPAAAVSSSVLPAAPGGSVFPAGGGPLLTGGAAVHISASGAAKATLYCRVFLLDGTEVSVDLPVSDAAGHW